MSVKETELKEKKEPVQEKEQARQSVVYCGPTVRGVTRQYTVYNNGLPEVMEEFFKKHPAAKRLLVPVDAFAKTRANLETEGTAESIIFNQIKKEL